MAAEHLCTLYGTQFGVPTVSLRYFTVFGPRQRPDMAINRIINAALNGCKFSVLGDGTQERDFTYVSDVVNATIKAAYFAETNGEPGECFNIAGGTLSSLNRTIAIVEEILQTQIDIQYIQKSIGDPHKTFANTDKAKLLLGWQPEIAFRMGIENQINYQSINVE
jgi:nucleoside-diphosphate-sugar epimerase